MRTFILRDPEHAKKMIEFIKANAGHQAAAKKPLVVTIEVYKAKRTGDQNRLLHALINEIAESAVIDGKQYDAEVWKDHVKRRFIGIEEVTLPDGTRLDRSMSTTDLNVGEFSELIERVRAWAINDLGITL
jgi:hypothetical protein